MEVNTRCSKKKELILVQAVQGINKFEFYLVDLEAREVLKTSTDSLFNKSGNDPLMRLGSFIYSMDGDTLSDFSVYMTRYIHENNYIRVGASCLELSIDDDEKNNKIKLRWNKGKQIPLMKCVCKIPSCVTLGGKVYALGSADGSCIGEVYDPELGRWEPMSSPSYDTCIERFYVSDPVIVDEKNSRLLVHLMNDDSLHAYYPNTNTWDCLATNLRLWLPLATLVDDVLYFHIVETPDCLVAYDLLSKSWLKVVYPSTCDVQFIFEEHDGMLNFGNGILCLASYCPVCEDDKQCQTFLQFYKLKVQRTSPGEVLVTPDGASFFRLDGWFTANNFILL